MIGSNTLSDMIVNFLEAWSINLSLQWLKVAQHTTHVGVANCQLTVAIVNTNSPPTPTSADHQWTYSTSSGYIQWLSLAKLALKVTLADRSRSLVAHASEFEHDISYIIIFLIYPMAMR